MKKVIRGRLYDTGTAKFIGETSGESEFPEDLNYWKEELYKKKTGEYFLHCEGGAGSRYAKHVGTSSTSGEHIIPLSFEQAQNWAEEHMSGAEYIEEFGEPEEDYTKRAVTFSLPQMTIDKLKSYAAKHDKSASAIIVELIETTILPEK